MGEQKKIMQFLNKKNKSTDVLLLVLGKDENIVKVKFGYNSLGAMAVKIVTDYQKKVLGDMKNCEFKAESITQNDMGIVGFEFVFHQNRLVEAEVFLAPIVVKIRNMRRKSSLNPYTQETNQNMKLSASIAMVKHVFKAYKNLKMNSSF